MSDTLDDGTPALPYAGTAGWSGSDTSKESAEREASNGTVARRQREVLRVLATQGPKGLTTREVGTMLKAHHGKASSTMSALHHDGLISRLKTVRRLKYAVYVLPEHVAGRETAPHGRKNPLDLVCREWLIGPLEGGPSKATMDPVGFMYAMRHVSGYL